MSHLGNLFLRWYISKLYLPISFAPLNFFYGVLCIGLSKVFLLLSVFIPIRVIILANSNQEYNFILGKNLGDKDIWIGSLVLLIFILLVSSVLLEAYAKQIAEIGRLKFIREYDPVLLNDNFFKFRDSDLFFHMRIIANFIFCLLSLVVIALFNSTIFVSMFALIIFSYLLMGQIFKNKNAVNTFLKQLITEKNRESIQFWEYSCVFIGFIILIRQLMFDKNENFIIYILVFIVLRQAFSAISMSILDLVRIARKAGVFVNSENELISPFAREFSQNFKVIKKKKLSDLVRCAIDKIAEQSSDDYDNQFSIWTDNDNKRVLKFIIHQNKLEEKKRFLLRISSKKASALELNEKYLFRFVDRKYIPALPLHASFQYSDLSCSIFSNYNLLDTKVGFEQIMREELLEKLWSYPPPSSLIAECVDRKLILYQRLNASDFEILSHSVNSSKDFEIVTRFIEKLPEIRSRLMRFPLFIYNPNLNPQNLSLTSSGNALLVDWWNWSVEPLGGGNKHRYDLEKLNSFLPSLKQKRKDIPGSLNKDDLFFARQCQLAEDQILNLQLSAALKTCDELLTSMDNTISF